MPKFGAREVVTVLLPVTFLTILGLQLPRYWLLVVAVVLAYVLADLVLTRAFARGGRGIVQFPLLRRGRTQRKPIGYFAYFFGIVVGTVGSEVIVERFSELIELALNSEVVILFGSVLIGLIVYVDFYSRFYARG